MMTQVTRTQITRTQMSRKDKHVDDWDDEDTDDIGVDDKDADDKDKKDWNADDWNADDEEINKYSTRAHMGRTSQDVKMQKKWDFHPLCIGFLDHFNFFVFWELPQGQHLQKLINATYDS